MLGAVVASGLSVVLLPAPAAVAAPCDAPIVSPVACENTKTGNPESQWGISGAGSSNIQGFATQMSVNVGETQGFKIDTNASSYRLDIYRMGYYNGMGARLIATVNPTTIVTNQPNCVTASATGLVDCGNWTQNASWTVPSDAVSGIYFAHLVRTDGTSGESHVFFVVRNDDAHSALLFQTSDTTWQAYNAYGGNSLYTGSPAGRAYKVSYNRPFTTRGNAPEDFVFNAEYPMVRWLESNGYDVSYTSGVDTDRRGAELLEHQVFLSVGHDEYWSGPQRANVEAARAAGVNLAFFSGNEIFWKTRWENSIDGSGTPYRTLVSYKETHANAVIDPQDPPTSTATWRDPRFGAPADGGRPENALSGTIFTSNCCATNMVVAAADGKMRFWRNTRVATLGTNQTTTVGTNTIGYEWDEDADNGSRPAGLIRLSQTTASAEVLQDYGSTYASGNATHSMTLYRAASGALVFGAGTIQWSWGLDANHDRGSAAADVAARQATVNLLADMGVQPTTLQSGLTAATASTDTTAPTSTITSPTANATVPVGSALTVTGTASDGGGGQVGGVEVSTDNGTTWHRASGRASWTYTFTPDANGTLRIRSRAADDSGNIETPGSGVTVTAGTGVPGSCPCSIWAASATPDRTDPDSAS
ncbi:N,N-dimethylformamidase beta subunit family domain-containing protein, partial [Nocardioides sp. GY 10113]|uniref:N,N-dimethylformamidase beta subunit family domain-containing protein n=1 Tax=Nocardioides sp. GY 10113 TaxID=2569761 RepID=UPI001F10B4E4